MSKSRIIEKLRVFCKSNFPEFVVRFIQNNNLKKILYAKSIAIYNLGIDPLNENQKKLLFSYDLSPYWSPKSSWNRQGHTHSPEFTIFVQKLIEKGYCVDVMHYLFTPFNIPKDYDVVIGLGKPWREAVKNNPKAKHILYLTEKSPSFSRIQEEERINYLIKRHGIKTKMERTGEVYIDEDFNNIKEIIAIGEEEDIKYFTNDKKVYFIQPTALINKSFDLTKRNVNSSKKHFLWFGSGGVVHKGLDLLFDVFSKHPDLTLHVCGATETNLWTIDKIMPKNVIVHGFINVQSSKFIEIASLCAFDIFPSCSEGIATSVLTCMNHGILPIITKECSIYSVGVVGGEILKDYKVETIEDAVVKWSNMDDAILEKQMSNVLNFARNKYNINNFSKNISEIINEIL